MKKLILILCSLVPLVLQMPYLISAWRTSRLDQWDWIFYLTAIAAAVWAGFKNKPGRFDHWALVLLVPALFLALTPAYHQVNALAVASSVVTIPAMVYWVGSWKFAEKFLPATLIMLLGTPSSSYALSLMLMCHVTMAWAIKFLLATTCIAWICCSKRFDLSVKNGTVCFAAMLLASIMVLLHSKEIYFEGRSFVPEFNNHIGEFWGRNIEPNENTKRFFDSSTVAQYRYTGNNVDISVLAVKCGSNIHEIHPASHCLRTSFWSINSEKILYLQDNLAVTEIDAQKGSTRFLIWVWYSSDDFSTPGFLGFRRHFRSDGNYYTYQLSTPITEGAEESRKILHKFVNALNNSGASSNEGIQ